MPIQDLLMYFNLGIIAIVVLFAFIGYIRGTYKSIYYLIVTIIVFVGGWFVMGPVTSWMLDLNLEARNIEIGGIQLTTIREFVPNYLSTMVAGSESLMAEDMMFSNLVFALVEMILRLVFFIVLIIFYTLHPYFRCKLIRFYFSFCIH